MIEIYLLIGLLILVAFWNPVGPYKVFVGLVIVLLWPLTLYFTWKEFRNGRNNKDGR